MFLQQHFAEAGAAADIPAALQSSALAKQVKSAATMNAVLTHRIDMLRPRVQLTLKVASVMGVKVLASLQPRMHTCCACPGLLAPARASACFTWHACVQSAAGRPRGGLRWSVLPHASCIRSHPPCIPSASVHLPNRCLTACLAAEVPFGAEVLQQPVHACQWLPSALWG